jgi:hypothetical protein
VTKEDQIAALFAEANPVRSLGLLDPLEPLDIDRLESRSKGSSVMTDLDTNRPKVVTPARWPRLALLAAVPVVVLAGVFFFGDRTSNVAAPSTSAASLAAPAPLTTAPPSTTPSPTDSPIDTTNWLTYQSERYGFSIAYPSDWILRPADHDWTMAGDADDWMSSGQEVFLAPTLGATHGIRVSAWSVPLDPGTTLETSADVEARVEEYCQLSEPVCTGFKDRAVPLCLEARDCHPGLLFEFDTDVQAFFPGSTDGTSWDRMVVVAIWRTEYDPAVRPYGGVRRLIEAFLSTMGVCPADDLTLC